jgi:hypothetical protein
LCHFLFPNTFLMAFSCILVLNCLLDMCVIDSVESQNVIVHMAA